MKEEGQDPWGVGPLEVPPLRGAQGLTLPQGNSFQGFLSRSHSMYVEEKGGTEIRNYFFLHHIPTPQHSQANYFPLIRSAGGRRGGVSLGLAGSRWVSQKGKVSFSSISREQVKLWVFLGNLFKTRRGFKPRWWSCARESYCSA